MGVGVLPAQESIGVEKEVVADAAADEDLFYAFYLACLSVRRLGEGGGEYRLLELL